MKRRKNLPETLTCCILIIAALCPSVGAQQDKADSVSFTTYYPSPNGVFTNLEVKRKLVVGNISESGNSQLDEISELGDGQIYVGDSLWLEPTTSQPTGTEVQEGQIIFNNTSGVKKLQFYNGSWQSAGG